MTKVILIAVGVFALLTVIALSIWVIGFWWTLGVMILGLVLVVVGWLSRALMDNKADKFFGGIGDD